MQEEYIIALDLSLLNTGYTICDNNFKVVKIGSILTNPKDATDKRLDVIWEMLKELREMYPPCIILIERAFTKFNTATQQLYRVHGITNLVFKGIKQVYYSPTSIKKALTGFGKSKKEDVQAKIMELYPNIKFNNKDESDSFALLVYHVHYKRKGAGDRCLYF